MIALLSLFLLPSLAGAQLVLAGSEVWEHPEDGWPFLGFEVAAGDFDGNGYDDVAVGSPSADAPGFMDRGKVFLRRIFADGQVIEQSTQVCLNDGTEGDGSLGLALAFGDFDDDGLEDLAVGMPGATAGGVLDAGGVCVIYGHPEGLASATRVMFSQTTLQGVPESGEEFGAALAAGDLNGDGIADLAIGAMRDQVPGGGPGVLQAGAVHVVYGGPGGLTAGTDLYFTRATPGVPWQPTSLEKFGSTLAIGDFVGDSVLDLAVGALGDNFAEGLLGGSVTIFQGSVASTLEAVLEPFTPSSPVWDLLGSSEQGDDFGRSLAAGDYNGDGLTDLAVGIPGDRDLHPEFNSGAVMVLYRVGDAISDQGEQIFVESTFGGAVTVEDRFGWALAAGDFDRDGRSDLVIGSPFDDPLGVDKAGKVTVVYGTETGLQVSGFQLIAMNFFGGLVPQENFGRSLAVGTFFDSQGGDDLLVGIPGRLFDDGVVAWPYAGGTVLIQNGLFHADGLETGDLSAWSVVVP